MILAKARKIPAIIMIKRNMRKEMGITKYQNGKEPTAKGITNIRISKTTIDIMMINDLYHQLESFLIVA